jgi:site-specific DNA recombinase
MAKSTHFPPVAAIYCRVSTTAQSEEGTSLVSQEAACRAYAEAHGYVVGPIFSDVHSGADLFGRDGMTALLAAIRQREVGVVIAHALDRLSRSQTHFGLIYSEASHAGVPIELVTEKLDDTPVGRFVMAANSFSAEIEREKIRERSLRGKKTRIQSGKLHNHAAELYGYRRDKQAGVRIVEPSEAAVVARIFDAITHDGASVRGMAKQLNAEAVPAPSTGKRVYRDGRVCRWNPSTLYRILSEPAYKGETVLWRCRARADGRSWQFRDEAEWVRLPDGTTPPIVPVATWDAALARLRATTSAATRNATRPYLLRGVIFCAVCGCRMHASPEHGKTTYRCSSRDRTGAPCGGKRAPGEAIEQWAWGEIETILRDPATIMAEVERRRASGPEATLAHSRDTAARLLAKLDKQRERLVRRYAEADDDSFPWDLVEREIARVEAERRQAQSTLADIDSRVAAQAQAIVQLDSLRDYCDRVGAHLDGADFSVKRNAVEALVERIEANGRDWTLIGSIPVSLDVGVSSHSSS